MTRKEIIKELSVEYFGDSEKIREAKRIAIKALKQEPILDKIRAEIKDNRDEWIKGQDPEWHAYERCLAIIDKYREEQE